MESTGFCWKCGCVLSKAIGKDFDLFCCKKHEEQFYRAQESKIKKGKRAGYGVAGSTH